MKGNGVEGVGEVGNMVAHLRDVVKTRPGETPVLVPQTYNNLLSFDLLGPRMASKGLMIGGGFGLLLAIIGIYGIVSFVVSQKAREMAIRVAMGAERRQVAWAVVRSGLGLVGVGVVVGLLISTPLGFLLESQLYGVKPLDPLSAGGAGLLLLLAGFAATLMPLRRALRIDPMEVLRSD